MLQLTVQCILKSKMCYKHNRTIKQFLLVKLPIQKLKFSVVRACIYLMLRSKITWGQIKPQWHCAGTSSKNVLLDRNLCDHLSKQKYMKRSAYWLRIPVCTSQVCHRHAAEKMSTLFHVPCPKTCAEKKMASINLRGKVGDTSPTVVWPTMLSQDLLWTHSADDWMMCCR